MIYEYYEKGILAYIPYDYEDYYDIVNIWCTSTPYSKYECSTITSVLKPAFDNKKLMAFKKGINTIGFLTWGYMTQNELDKKYFHEDIFSRDSGDNMVLIDVIINERVMTCMSHIRKFQKLYYPHLKKIHFYRSEYDRQGFVKLKDI